MLIKTTILVLCILFVMNVNTPSQTSIPMENGVSQKLAQWRSTHYSDVRYKLNITLEKGAPLMKGELEIRVTLTEEAAKSDLALDWRTTQFEKDKDKPYAWVMAVNENKTPPVVAIVAINEHLKIPYNFLKPGENIIRIEFASPIKTSGAAITRYVDKEDGGEYIYSLFVPSDASTAFPCFDQPDLKAKFELKVKKPRDWDVVSNALGEGFEVSSSDPGQSGSFITFVETRPISTYVFAFAAGPFVRFSEPQGLTPGVKPDLKKVYKEWLEKDVSGLMTANDTKQMRDEENARLSKGYALDSEDFLHIFVRRSQAEKFKPHAAEVFRLNREGVKFLEDYFDHKFPFPKYDLVLIPEFPFGGMEHAGATFLREDSIIFPQEPTANNYISRANVIFHEAAHQWFGDTVTMRWFDDLWLKEGFAEFMAYKTLEKTMPQYNAWKVFYERNKQAAYLTDSTKGTTPIYQEIPNLSAAKSAYGNIVYRKAPSFLRQAEFYIGPDKFQAAARAFLKKHEFGNAGWEDLVKEFEITSAKDLKAWGSSWIKQRGMPMIKGTTDIEKIWLTAAFETPFLYGENSQTDILKEGKVWNEKVQFLCVFSGGYRSIAAITFDDDKNRKPVPPGDNEPTKPKVELSLLNSSPGKDEKPLFVFPNYQDYGYGVFLMDDKSKKYVLENIQNEKDDFLRAMMWGSLWDSVREGELDPKDYVELVIKNLALSPDFSRPLTGEKPPKGGTQNSGEFDETTIAVLLGRVSTAMNYYVSEKQRGELAPRVENLLIGKLKHYSSAGQRLTFYRSFLGMASTERARNVLKHILKGELSSRDFRPDGEVPVTTDSTGGGMIPDNYVVDQIQLKTKDKFDIVTRLLILGDKDAPALLADLEKTETSDEAKRYAYAAKAGIGTAENKAKYFGDFVNNKTISESWIEAAFGPFNSIRHSDVTIAYLEKALAELPNLKRDRKIFFINGWLGAFIGGQRSERALQIVNKFFADNPQLDKDLRLKILENVDLLERAVKIRAKFGD